MVHDWPMAAAILAAGFAAGTVNGVIGAGALITFPALVLLGIPPLQANMATTLGVQPGFWSATYALRADLASVRPRLRAVLLACVAGGALGGGLLLALPSSVFPSVAPYLILAACVIVGAGPRLTRRGSTGAGATGAGATGEASPTLAARLGPSAATVALGAVSVYIGYFGAGGAFLYLAVLQAFVTPDLRAGMAVRSLVSGAANAAAALVFIAFAPVPWAPALLLAAGSFGGGIVGARVGRWLPVGFLRALVVGVGVLVAARLILG